MSADQVDAEGLVAIVATAATVRVDTEDAMLAKARRAVPLVNLRLLSVAGLEEAVAHHLRRCLSSLVCYSLLSRLKG